MVGNPVTYAVSDEYDIEAIKNEYLEQDMPSVDSEIVKNMSIYGKAYELFMRRKKQAEKCTIGSGAYICMLLTVGI